jgi:hypothetical protein
MFCSKATQHNKLLMGQSKKIETLNVRPMRYDGIQLSKKIKYSKDK